LSDPKNFTLSNHGLYMVVGLAALLKALPELRDFKRMQSYANDRMRALIRSQYASEGMHLEHSPGYHLMVTRGFRRFAATGLFPEVPELAQMAKRARAISPDLFHPGGDLALLGDTDRKRSKKPRTAAGPERPDPALRVYPQAGYAMVRALSGSAGPPPQGPRQPDFLIMSAGHHSFVHKHADHLSFEWSFRGKPILVDSGKYTYNRSKWREFFRSTRAGNSVEVDGRDFDRHPKKDAPSGLADWGDLEGSYFVAARRKHAEVGVEQNRALVVAPGDYLLVIDLLTAKQKHRFSQWFHFHERLAVSQASGTPPVIRVEEGGQTTFVQWLGHRQGDKTTLVKGQEKPRIQGWLSPRYHEKLERYSLAQERRAQDTALVALFTSKPVSQPLVETSDHSVTVSWRTPRGKRAAVAFSPGQKPSVRAVE
jgi:hypothetical protein